MNLSQKSLNRGRSIFFRESLVAASNKEKEIKNTKFSLKKTSVSDTDWIRIKIGSVDLDWDSGSRSRFMVAKCTPK
jgi:hypothetical protein